MEVNSNQSESNVSLDTLSSSKCKLFLRQPFAHPSSATLSPQGGGYSRGVFFSLSSTPFWLRLPVSDAHILRGGLVRVGVRVRVARAGVGVAHAPRGGHAGHSSPRDTYLRAFGLGVRRRDSSGSPDSDSRSLLGVCLTLCFSISIKIISIFSWVMTPRKN